MTEANTPHDPPDSAAIRAAFEADYFADAPARARERSGDGYKYMAASVAWGTWQRAWSAAPTPQPAAEIGALRLVADVRFALGDNGKRMQPELIEWCKGLRRDAERYQWLRDAYNRPTDDVDEDGFSVVGGIARIMVVTDRYGERTGFALEELDAAIDAAKGGTQ